MRYKEFAAFIVVILLVIYCIVLGNVIYDLLMLPTEEYISPSERAIAIITAIGGLISAVIVAQLARTNPGRVPTLSGAQNGNKIEKGLVTLYMIFWILIGGFCLYIGTFVNDNETLINDTGTTWLGIAVAAAYAYFGITQKS